MASRRVLNQIRSSAFDQDLFWELHSFLPLAEELTGLINQLLSRNIIASVKTPLQEFLSLLHEAVPLYEEHRELTARVFFAEHQIGEKMEEFEALKAALSQADPEGSVGALKTLVDKLSSTAREELDIRQEKSRLESQQEDVLRRMEPLRARYNSYRANPPF